MIYQEQSRIIQNIQIATGYFYLVVESPRIAADAQPGQFAEIRVTDTMDPLLRRPISFFHYGDGRLEFIYRVVGHGTDLLSRRIAGESLDLLGPLGKGFDQSQVQGRKVVVLGGGMGIIPLYPLILQLQKNGVDYHILNGARNREELLLLERFEQAGLPFSAITDDGSYGEKGLITTLLQDQLNAKQVEFVCACGPHAMLRAVAAMLAASQIPCQVSLEEKMACGLGACLGCVVMTTSGQYRKVCKDGPVFTSTDIAW